MTHTLAKRASILVLAAVSILAVSSACGIADLDLTGKNCPCATDQGFVCDTATNKCVRDATVDAGIVCADAGCACTTDTDCVDPAAPKCVSSQCVACATSPDSCPVGTYCLNGQGCAPGCKIDSDCQTLSPSSPYCDLNRHQCVQCRQKSDCPGSDQCSPSGSCAQSCDGDASSCPAGNSCCGGLCIDTTSDILNCSECDKTCSGADTLCCNSACTDPLTTTADCGACGFDCSNVNNTPTCSGGNCVYNCTSGHGHCQPGNTGCETSNLNSLHQCGAACVDCTTAILHASGASCSGNGGTSCDYTTCNSSYIDNDGNRANGCEAHCGSPNQTCCPGGICQIGTCQGNNRCPDD